MSEPPRSPRRVPTRPLGWRDYALAAAALVITAESPFTPDELGPSIAMGVLVGAWVLWRQSTQPARAVAPDAPTLRERIANTDPAAVLVVVLFALVSGPTLQWMYWSWTSGIWRNQHGLLFAVLIAALTAAALRREKSPIVPSMWGLLPFGAGLALLALDAQVRTNYVGAIGFVVALPGLSLLVLGAIRTRALVGPLILSAFLVPIPYTLTQHLFLREITAIGTTFVLEAMGIQAHRDATFITIPLTTFQIADACSGFATLVAGTGIALILSSQVKTVGRRVALWVALVPLVLVTNVARATVLLLMSRFTGSVDILDTPLHPASGVAVFLVMLIGLYWIADRPQLTKAFA